MPKKLKETKTMSIGELSKRLVTRSQTREQPSTSVFNPLKVTTTDLTPQVDGYKSYMSIFII